MSVSALPRLALVGDHGNHNEPSHPRIDAMMPHWGVEATWIPTVDIHDTDLIGGYDGIWVVPGAPYLNQKGVQQSVRYARENKVPFLGTCGGFFSALIEHAQNVLELPEAEGVDEDPEKLMPLVTPLKCSFLGEKAPLVIRPGSRISAIYGGATEAEEVFHCDYGLTTEFMGSASRGDLSICAWDVDSAPRALEMASHPFFLGTLFQPELASTAERLHPIIVHFLDAVRLRARTTAPAV